MESTSACRCPHCGGKQNLELKIQVSLSAIPGVTQVKKPGREDSTPVLPPTGALTSRQVSQLDAMGDESLLRIWQIVGDPHADPPVLPLIPISKTTIWAWVKAGRFPAPVNLGPRTTAWRVGDVRRWLTNGGARKAGGK